MGMLASVVCLHPHLDTHYNKSQLAQILPINRTQRRVIIPERNYLVQLAYIYTNFWSQTSRNPHRRQRCSSSCERATSLRCSFIRISAIKSSRAFSSSDV